MNTHTLLQFLTAQAESLMTEVGDSVLTPAASAVRLNIWGWYEQLPGFWQALIPSLAAGLLVLVLGWILKVPQKLRAHVRRRRQARKGSPLVDWKDFYGDDLDVRHGFKFVVERVEKVERDGQPRVEESKPLDTVLNWIDGGGRLLVIRGTGGLGKSRLLVEAARRKAKLRFVRTRQAERNIEKLAGQVSEQAGRGDVLVFDDCQEYAGDFGRLLDAAQNAGARVIAATRYPGTIEAAFERAHAMPVVLELAPMDNAVQVVPAEDKDVRRDIARIANRNPAFAVMAWKHYQRTGTLHNIEDAFGLMKSVFRELCEAGEQAGFADTREFLAAMAVRGGLWQDHPPFPGHEKLVTKLKRMGHVGEGGTTGRRAYGVIPDQLRDHVIREVYADGGVFQQAEYERMLAQLPYDEAIHVVRMLGIQHRETEDDVWKRAVAVMLDKLGRWSHDPGIGFNADVTRRPHELVIDVGYEAWKQFGDIALVRDHLGDFCAGAEKLDSTDHLNKAGVFCANTGEPDRALAYFEAGLKLAEARDDKHGQAIFLVNIGLIWRDKGEVDAAMKYQQKALAIARELVNRQDEARALSNIGLIWQARAEGAPNGAFLDKALECHQEALAIDEELRERQEQASDLGNIGNVWLLKGDLVKAQEYQDEALRVSEETGATQEQARILGNIGNVYYLKDDLVKALEYQEKALTIDRKLGDRLGEARTLGNIGLIRQVKGELDKALENYLQALALFDAVGARPGYGKAMHHVGRVMGELGREKFVAACVKAGMEQEAAEKLAEQFETQLKQYEEDGRRFRELGRERYIADCRERGYDEDTARAAADHFENEPAVEPESDPQ